MDGQVEYRLALIQPESRELLVVQNNKRSQLPRVVTTMGQRQVEQITQLVQQKWGIRATVLEMFPETCSEGPCAVMEIQSLPSAWKDKALQQVWFASIDSDVLIENERRNVNSLLSEDQSQVSPLAHVGWIKDVQQWIRDSTQNSRLSFCDDVQQLNAGSGFALCRFCTHEGVTYWLKAVGHPNKHEFQVTRELATHLPNYLPRIIAMREEWNAWIMEDSGTPLSELFTLPQLERAVGSLAQLQIDSIEHIDRLRMAGCRDSSIAVLDAHLEEITEYLIDAMAKQTSSKVPRIESPRLRELESVLRDACHKMQDLGIPDTLIHNDINAGNILVSESHCVFIDWAEASIGNPFFTFQHICAQIVRDSPDSAVWLLSAKRSYQQTWSGRLSERQIDRACALMPALGILSYLFGRGDWLGSALRNQPRFQGYARTLARYIDRASRMSEFREAICL